MADDFGGDECAAAAASFLRDYGASELAFASEFLANWLPFLSRGLCSGCSPVLRDRVLSLRDRRREPPASPPSWIHGSVTASPVSFLTCPYEEIEPSGWGDEEPKTPASSFLSCPYDEVPTTPGSAVPPRSPRAVRSWADMTREQEVAEEREGESTRGSSPGTGKGGEDASRKKAELTREQREMIRFRSVGRKKDFVCMERVNGRTVNILEGLELHTGVFSSAEQKRIVDSVYDLQEKGRNHQLGDRTYSAPVKWMKGKGRVTIQFGCCYNYAMDKDGNPPGILKKVVADPLPPLFKVIVKRLVRWHVLPTSCTPDSCIVNIYEPGDCIPPHIDSHDFSRPFCTVSFLSECSILFGSSLKVAGAGEFTGSSAIPLPVGSVLVLSGNGADIAKHCVPAVPTKRISITFRKMDEAKWPFGFTPEADLKNIQPLTYNSTSYHEEVVHEVESRNSTEEGRTGVMHEPNFQESQTLPDDPGLQAGKSLSRINDRSPTNNNLGWGSDSFPRTVASKFYWRSHDTRSCQHQIEDHVNNSMHNRLHEGESCSIGGNREYNRRRTRLQQQKVLVCRNDEEEPTPQGSAAPFNVSRE